MKLHYFDAGDYPTGEELAVLLIYEDGFMFAVHYPDFAGERPEPCNGSECIAWFRLDELWFMSGAKNGKYQDESDAARMRAEIYNRMRPYIMDTVWYHVSERKPDGSEYAVLYMASDGYIDIDQTICGMPPSQCYENWTSRGKPVVFWAPLTRSDYYYMSSLKEIEPRIKTDLDAICDEINREDVMNEYL